MRAYERLLKYVKYPTMSNPESSTTPSTKKQLVLAEELKNELISLGLTDATLDEYGYVYATLDGNVEGAPTIGLIAHVDTSDAVSDEGVNPRILKYAGGDIVLNEELGIVMRESVFTNLKNHIGEELIVTDGTTLLGADDKAGIADIMTALEVIIEKELPHGKIRIGFTPDEEIGRGANHFDVDGFGADYAYTLDGGFLGEIGYENFNATSASVVVTGVSEHPGSAKGKMKNAIRILSEFNSNLPEGEIPELTEGYEGFHHLTEMSGDVENARADYILRDHDRAKLEERKKIFESIAKRINEKYGDVLSLTLTDSYYNMREVIDKTPEIVESVRDAMHTLGIPPCETPIRGGTDGARLTFMGLPCPNICTGGENFHSRYEFASVNAMDKTVELIVKIITNAAK